MAPHPAPGSFQGWQHPRYEVLGELSRGGMGVVLRARHRELGNELALKLILTHDPSPQLLARFEREAQTLASLDHPGIVKIADYGRERGLPFLAMHLVRGRDLKEIVDEGLRSTGLPPDFDWTAKVFAGIAEALAHCHAQGVVHRDLKPANVVITEDGGRPVVIDFGLVKDEQSRDHLSRTGEVLGTPQFMAPEQLDPSVGQVGPSSDVWGFGAALLYCLTGKTAFPGASAVNIYTALLTRDPPRARGLHPDVPAWLDGLCADCMQRDPSARPGMTTLAERLRAGLSVPPESRGRPAIVWGLLALVLLLGGGLWVASRTTGPESPRKTEAPTPSPVDAPATKTPAQPTPKPVVIRVEADASLAEVVARAPAGATLSLSPGTYRVTRLVFERAITLRADPKQRTLIRLIGPAALRIRAPGVTLRGLTLIQKRPVERDAKQNGALFVEAARTLLADCTIEANANRAVVIPAHAKTAHLTLRRCTLRRSSSALSAYAGEAVLEDCEITGITTSGVSVAEMRLTLRRCQVHHNAHSGVYARTRATVRVEESRVHHNKRNGIGVHHASTLSVRGTDSYQNTNDGVQVQGGTTLDLVGGRLYGNNSGLAVFDSTATLRKARLENNRGSGLYLVRARVTVLGSLSASNKLFGALAIATTITLRDTILSRNQVGIVLRDTSEARVHALRLLHNKRAPKQVPASARWIEE